MSRFLPPSEAARARAPERNDDADLVRSIESVRAAVRRQNGTETPIGPKAQRTRARLIERADELFQARGYNAVSVADIAAAAEVAEATLYQYFSGRAGVFMAVAGEHAIAMFSSGVRDWDPSGGATALRDFVANYVHLYAADAAFFRVWEEATAAEAEVAALRREFFGAFKRRMAGVIRRGMAIGAIASAATADEMARALTRGIEAYLFDAVVFDPATGGTDESVLATTLSAIWTSALGLA